MNATLLRYLAARTARALLTVFGVVSLLFVMVHLIPGDPVSAILGDQAAPEDRAALRVALRLDRPLPLQYLAFLGDIADGSLGHSFRMQGTSVAALITHALPFTLSLALGALSIALCIALPLGALAAARRNTRWDSTASTFALLGLAIPNIWLGPLLVLCFGVWLRVLPMPGDAPSFAGSILPACTIGFALAAILTRQARASLLEVLSEQYIRAARARGIGERTLLFRHALRNALLPVLTIAGAQLGALLSGAVIAEKIFERPGLGTLFLEAFLERDIPVVQGTTLVIALFYVLTNLAIDLLYGVVDPRLRRA
jgi:ABC-type dipeptide/oligopeptide/nickel transport system permease component